jgi:membrane protein
VIESIRPDTEAPDAVKPTSRNLDRTDWRYAAVRAWHGFIRHRGIDSAGTLAYFSALALFPGALTVVSAFAVIDSHERAQDHILTILSSVARPEVVDAARAPIAQLLSIPNPGVALAVAVALLLWTVSSYATAFGRVVNTAYDLQEGRPLWRFRGSMILVAAALILCFAIVAVLMLTTPTVATAVARSLGLGATAVALWNLGKWPIAAGIGLLAVALLYFFSPNIRHARFRWVSWGALAAVIGWGAASAGFALFVTTVGQYNEVYGWLGGALVALLWLYLTNLVLVLGAEGDAEIVRARQLAAGMASEESIQLPIKDTRRNLRVARQLTEDQRRSRALREAATLDALPPVEIN